MARAPRKGRKIMPAPGLADQAVGQEMAEFMDQQGDHQQQGNAPSRSTKAKAQSARCAGDERPSPAEISHIGAVVGLAGFGQALEAVGAAPEIGAGQDLGEQRPRPPDIGELNRVPSPSRAISTSCGEAGCFPTGPRGRRGRYRDSRARRPYSEIGLRRLGGTTAQGGHEAQAVGPGWRIDQLAVNAGALPALVVALAEIEQRKDLLGRRGE